MGMDSRKARRLEVAVSLEAAKSRVALQALGNRRAVLEALAVVAKTVTAMHGQR